MLAIDAHAHFQPAWKASRFLDAAWSNLRRVAVAPDRRRHGAPGDAAAPPCACLFLSDPRGVNGADRLRRAVENGEASAWRIVHSSDARSYTVEAPDGGPLLIVAGRQLVTTDGLEVLTPGVREWITPMSLRETLCTVAEAGGVPIVPWGFGKWWGRRGRLLEGLVREPPAGIRFHIGDSALRPALIPRPRTFAIGAGRNVFDLPGSDPLPLDGQDRRAGSFGFVLDLVPDQEDPVESILSRLRRLDEQPRRFGSSERLRSFVAGQITLRTRAGSTSLADDAEPHYFAGR